MPATLEVGEELFKKGKVKEAKKVFLKLIKTDGDNPDLYNNLGVIAFDQVDYPRALLNFEKALKLMPHHKDALVNYFTLLKQTNALPKSMQLLKEAARAYPQDNLFKEFLREASLHPLPRQKIAFFCLPGLQSFLPDITETFAKDHDIRLCYSRDPREINAAANWADTLWLEWANEMAGYITTQCAHAQKKKVICRLHGYEVFTDLPQKVNWKLIDYLIFVAKHKQDIFNQRFRDCPAKQLLIRNGINTARFAPPPNKENTKQLVFLGHLNFRKGLPLLLHFYHQLLKTDPEYFLHIRGDFQDPRLQMAASTMVQELSLQNKLRFVPWVEDLNKWLSDKSHILSFSLEESFHYSIGNGMAAGLKPVIHAWMESRQIWPNEFIFRDFDEFIKIVKDPAYSPIQYRDWVKSHFPLRDQLAKIEIIFNEPLNKSELSISKVKEYYNRRYGDKQERSMRPEKAYGVFLDRLEAKSPGRLLDVSCGTGYLLKNAKERGLTTYGIDISFEATKISRRISPKSSILNSSGEFLPFKDHSFDYVTCIGSLEHFLDMHLGLTEIHRVLKPEGTACIVLPNENFVGWKNSPQKGTQQQEINENLKDLDSWEELLESDGFQIISILQDNAVCPHITVPDDLCYQFIFICRKDEETQNQSSTRPRKILMTGGYGFSNVGDEAILHSLIRVPGSPLPKARIRAITGNTSETSRLHPYIEKAVLYDFSILQKEIMKTDLLLFGGGGVFYDFNNPNLKNLGNRCALINMAAEAGKKVALLGIGVDNLGLNANKALLKEALDKAALITVRDERSLKVLRNIGLTNTIHLTADPAFLLYDESLVQNDRRHFHTIGLCLRPTYSLLFERPDLDENVARNIACELDQIMLKTDFHAELISCKPGYDDIYAKQVVSFMRDPSKCTVIPLTNWNEVIAHQLRYRVFIGMSLHSLIFAFMTHTPMIGISYSEKIDSLLQRLGIPEMGLLQNFNRQSLVERFEAVESNTVNFNFKEINLAMRREAQKNFSIFSEVGL